MLNDNKNAATKKADKQTQQPPPCHFPVPPLQVPPSAGPNPRAPPPAPLPVQRLPDGRRGPRPASFPKKTNAFRLTRSANTPGDAPRGETPLGETPPVGAQAPALDRAGPQPPQRPRGPGGARPWPRRSWPRRSWPRLGPAGTVKAGAGRSCSSGPIRQIRRIRRRLRAGGPRRAWSGALASLIGGEKIPSLTYFMRAGFKIPIIP
jgi:hypothetical protein